MSTQSGVASSDHHDAFTAGETAARDAAAQLAGSPDLLLVFGAAGYDQQRLLAGVRSQADGARIVGCSGEGVIAGDRTHELERVVAVLALRSDSIRFEPFLLRDYSADPAARGRELGAAVAALEDVFGLWVMPDGLTGNCTSFLAGLKGALGRDVPVVGGTSADAFTFTASYQYLDDVSAADAISAVALCGRGHMEVAVSHGCLPVGRPRTVTRAADGWVMEIDGQPAWSVFREYLDGDPSDLNAEGIVQLCIGVKLDERLAQGYAGYVIRTPLQLDKDTGALFFPGGGLSEGQEIQLTRRDPRQIQTSATECARGLRDRRPSAQPAVVVQFDCAGRGGIMFGSETDRHTLHPLQELLGEGTPWIGCHVYGEIAPIGDELYYHNYTVALCAVYDAPTS